MISKKELLARMDERKGYLTPMQESVLGVIDAHVRLAALEHQTAVVLSESLLFGDIKHQLWMITDEGAFMQDIVEYVSSLGYEVRINNDNSTTLNRFYLAVLWS